MYNSFVCLGALIGPLIGGWLNDKYGYRKTNDLMAISVSIYAFIFLLSSIDLEIVKKSKKF